MARLFCLLLCLGCFLSACAPTGNDAWKRHGLVDVRRQIPGICVDLRYQTAHNTTNRPLYPSDMPCLLRPSTANRLQQAQKSLRQQGYGLCIWDAWRPPEAHQKLHDHGKSSGLFIDPANGWSRHCAGVSVDATLVDRHGRAVAMPTHFDADLEHAASQTQHPDPAVRRHVEILHQAMCSAGLIPLPGEWWHFDDCDFLYRPTRVIHARTLGIRLPD